MSQLHLTLSSYLYGVLPRGDSSRVDLAVYIVLVEGASPCATWEDTCVVHEITLRPAYRARSVAAGRAIFAAAYRAIDTLLGEHELHHWLEDMAACVAC